MQEADLSCPITVIMKGESIHRIVDGHHRIHAAHEQGMTSIPATLIPIESLPDHVAGIFQKQGDSNSND